MNPHEIPFDKRSHRSFTVTMLLAMFLGFLGIHRIYVKRLGLGIAMLSTAIVCFLSFLTIFLVVGFDSSIAGAPQNFPDWIIAVTTVGIVSYIGVGISAIIALVDIVILAMHEFKDGDGFPVMPRIAECSHRSYLVTLILLLIVGMFGVHRFYAGRYITGVLMLITLGGFGLWWLVDMVLIAILQFKDSDELPIVYN